MRTIGSLLLVAFVVSEWLVTFPLRRRSKWVFRTLLMVALFIALVVPTGDKRFDTPASAASLDHGYGLVSWEFENFFDKWTHRVWTVFPWTPTNESDRREALDRYIVLVDEIRAAKAELNLVTTVSTPDFNAVVASQNEVDRLIGERDEIRPSVEEYLEQIIAESVRSDEIALVSSFVWPPVDFLIGDPPKLLVTSPRNEISRTEDVLIDPDISIEDMSRIENELIDDHDISAVILQTGGLASYPNVIPTTHLKRLVDTAAHEWLHAHLVFYPLGQAYFSGGDIRSMNETLADIFGREVGLRVYSEVTGEPFVAPVRPETASKKLTENKAADVIEIPESFNFNRFMGETRRKTDELLAENLVDQAEAYMESRRVELLDHGYQIRKVNQAYFAFHGTYAESPSSTSPIARYLWDLREQVATVGDLVKLLRPIRTFAEFEQLVADRGIELEHAE
ncbi:MAG: hypothetical protein HOE50_05580 [Chloroflexi bacterium]|jgi:hypothetical protein|nr:hypothetical protein [Chloroflexota bacterium]MBT5477129.1 hypothetical protein [Chloroflexota bacterium]